MTTATKMRPATPTTGRWQALRPSALTFAAVFVATAAVFATVNFLAGEPAGRTVRLGVAMIAGDAVIAFPLCLLMVGLRHRQDAGKWAAIILSALLVMLVQSLWDTQVRLWVGLVKPGMTALALNRSMTINTYQTGMLVALLAFQSAYSLVAAQRHDLIAARANERAARMASLRFQLNPHFLFNTMNAVSSLVVLRRNEEAEAMIGRLTDFLRNTLSVDPQVLVPLEDEFAMLESYLGIEQVRFGDRLAADLSLPPALGAVRVPPFLLQPLVENAMKYAVAASRTRVLVTIAAALDGDELVLDVTDDGGPGGTPPGGTGVGHANIRSRLALQYGAAASLETACLDGGYRARVRLPIGSRP